MTSANRPIDSPLRSATGRLSSRVSRNVVLLSAGALAPAAGVVVIGSLFFPDGNVLPVGIITMPSAATMAHTGKRKACRLALPQVAGRTHETAVSG